MSKIEKQFHRVVKTLVVDTVVILKMHDKRYGTKLKKTFKSELKKGDFEDIAASMAALSEAQQDFDTTDIMEAAIDGTLEQLSDEVNLAQVTHEVAIRWSEVTTCVELMPSLTWPVVKA